MVRLTPLGLYFLRSNLYLLNFAWSYSRNVFLSEKILDYSRRMDCYFLRKERLRKGSDSFYYTFFLRKLLSRSCTLSNSSIFY